MEIARTRAASSEGVVSAMSGWPMLAVNLALLLGGPVVIVVGASMSSQTGWGVLTIFAGILMDVLALISLSGHFTLQPNEARVLILFGEYRGTVRQSAFYWANPFYSRRRGGKLVTTEQGAKGGAAAPGPLHSKYSTKISLRAQTLNGDRLKVNDKRGNPIEIAAIVIWRVEDTAKAVFDVEDYEAYVRTQTESALRHLASGYAYDHGEEHETTLRSGAEEVSLALQQELQERLNKAGIVVEEARLTHLAYAPEIAQAMLRRQQAEAVIAARQKIVHGACRIAAPMRCGML